ncbi:MAG: CAP domain-containing protein [Isosphaeraceae bacterium]
MRRASPAFRGRIACSFSVALALVATGSIGRISAEDDPPEPPPAHVPPEPKSLTKVLKRLIDLHNAERRKEDAEPLEPDARLMAAALRQAQDMAKAGKSGHTGSDESTMITRTRDAGYRFRFLGENVAGGQRTPDEAMAGWMNSEGHRKNVLNPDYTQIGVASVRSRRGINFWCAVFGRPFVPPTRPVEPIPDR